MQTRIFILYMLQRITPHTSKIGLFRYKTNRALLYQGASPGSNLSDSLNVPSDMTSHCSDLIYLHNPFFGTEHLQSIVKQGRTRSLLHFHVKSAGAFEPRYDTTGDLMLLALRSLELATSRSLSWLRLTNDGVYRLADIPDIKSRLVTLRV